MAANLLGHLLSLNLNGMFVFFHQSLLYVVRHEAMHGKVLVVRHTLKRLHLAEAITRYGIFVGETFGACQLIHTRVRTGIHHIVLNVHGLTCGCLNHRHCVVGILELRTFATLFLLNEFRTGKGF